MLASSSFHSCVHSVSVNACVHMYVCVCVRVCMHVCVFACYVCVQCLRMCECGSVWDVCLCEQKGGKREGRRMEGGREGGRERRGRAILSLENHPTKTKSKYTLSGLLPAFNSTLCLSIKLKGVSDVVTITVHFFYFTFANLGYFSDFIIAICGCGFAI